MTYQIDSDAGLVRFRGAGLVTDDELVACVRSLRGDPELGADMNTLADMRDVDVGFTAQGVDRIIGVMEATAERRRSACAAIVVNGEAAYGMGRMLELQSEDRADPVFRIFRSMDEARAWLGLEPERRG